jgi:hypothetical protein
LTATRDSRASHVHCLRVIAHVQLVTWSKGTCGASLRLTDSTSLRSVGAVYCTTSHLDLAASHPKKRGPQHWVAAPLDVPAIGSPLASRCRISMPHFMWRSKLSHQPRVTSCITPPTFPSKLIPLVLSLPTGCLEQRNKWGRRGQTSEVHPCRRKHRPTAANGSSSSASMIRFPTTTLSPSWPTRTTRTSRREGVCSELVPNGVNCRQPGVVAQPRHMITLCRPNS